MALLVVHGLLHLLGMDHEVEAEAERMERRERDPPGPLPPVGREPEPPVVTTGDRRRGLPARDWC